MKRLALILAAAVLGTGCIFVDDGCNTRDVDVTWSGFTGPAEGSNVACGTAGVAYVDVFLDGAQVIGPVSGPVADGHFNCNDYGATVRGVEGGSYVLTVEGLDGNENILFRDERTLSASGCGALQVATLPAAADVTLAYQFYDGPTLLTGAACAGPQLWLSIFDETANLAGVVLANSAATAFTCGDLPPLELALGTYSLRWMEERSAGGAVESADCTNRTFSVAGDTSVPVHLDVNATGSCVRD